MIGKVAGRIDYIAEDHALIDVKGIGYLVYCSERTLRIASPRSRRHSQVTKKQTAERSPRNGACAGRR